MITEFIIEGKCIAKERPRKSKTGQFYTPKKTLDYEAKVAWSYRAIPVSRKKYYCKGVPVKLEIEIYQAVPKSWNKLQKELALSKKLFPTKKDSDNQEKSIFDGLNKVAYDDDSQVVDHHTKEFYGDRDYVVVRIGELKYD